MTEEWWRGAVIYQVYPRSFLDTNGDGIGDLNGISRKLEYIASLGVDAVWISPFFKSPQRDFGYDVEDYRAIDPLFGSLEDFDRLLAQAHRLGLRILLDLVLNHTSDQHPWFVESRMGRTGPKADWYTWADAKPDGTPPNNWLSIFGGSAWQWDPHRQQYYLHNFLVAQPDLNLHSPDVQDALLAEADFWLTRGVDGFRLDATNFYMHDPLLRNNPPRPTDLLYVADARPDNPYYMQAHVYDKSQPENIAFLRRLRALLDRYPGTIAIAEIGDDDHVTRTAEYIRVDLLHTAYNFTFLDHQFGPEHVVNSVLTFEKAAGNGWPSWAFSNHDTRRVVSRWGDKTADERFAKMLLALLFSLRGTLFLYQGEELGLPESEVPYDRLRDPYGITFWPTFKGRDGCRTPMPWTSGEHAGFSTVEPWLPMNSTHQARCVNTQESEPDSPLAFTRRFLAWRRSLKAMRQGTIRFLNAPEGVVAFERRWADECVLCVLNLVDSPRQYTPLHGLPTAQPRDTLTLACHFDGSDTIVLPGYSAFFTLYS